MEEPDEEGGVLERVKRFLKDEAPEQHDEEEGDTGPDPDEFDEAW